MRARLSRAFLCAILVMVSAAALAADQSKALNILRVTPAGDDVPPSRQIVIEFNRPVVPVGRMERTAQEVGVVVDPPLNCQWRWLNTSALSCNLDEKDTMKSATRYRLAINPVIAAEDGGQLPSSSAEYGFTTQRPAAGYTSFKTWRGPGTPVIRVVFNQPVSKSSVERHLYMTVQESKVRRPVIVRADEDDQKLPDYMYVPGEKAWLRIDAEARKSDDKKTEINGEEARRVWLVEPQDALLFDKTAALRIEPGLISAEGLEPGSEERDIVTFDTFPDFRFAGVRCFSNTGDEILIKTGEPQKNLCNPMRSVELAFTSPVLRSKVKDNAVFKPDLAGGRKDYNPWGDENRDWSSLGNPHQKDRLYYVGLPMGLKAAQAYDLALPGQKQSMLNNVKSLMGYKPEQTLEDEFGRMLPQAVQMNFATDHRNPNFEMPYQDAVLESGVESELALYVNNLNSYSFNYRAVMADNARENQTYKQDVRKIEDVQYALPAGVRSMLEGKSGALYGHIQTDPQVPEKSEGDYRLFAQVTPWQVHMKLGHFSSLVWVTELATGKPVEGAKVTVYKDAFTTLAAPKDIATTVMTNADGLAVLPGAETFDPDQELLNHWKDEEPRLFVRLEKGSDMALLPLSNGFALNTWNMSDDGTWSSNLDRYGHMKSWGLTAQGIYRAGDTMQYKIFLRHQDDQTLTQPPKGRYALEITDPLGKTVYEVKDVVFSDFGAYAGEYAIPESGAVGWYDFKLNADCPDPKRAGKIANAEKTDGETQEGEQNEKGKYTLHPLRVLVSDFTPAPFKVSTEIGGDKFHPGDTMNIESRAALHSGGPYGDAAVRATVTLKQGYFAPDNPVAKGFVFGTAKDGKDVEQLFQKSAILDGKGEWAEKFTLPQQPIYFGKLEVESAVQDDRGKSIASMAQADYVGVDRFVGVKSPQWFYEAKKPVMLQAIVVGEDGAPVSGTKIAVSIEREDISVAKVKGAGNAYLSDITREWKQAASCEQTSTLEGQECAFTPTAAGTYRATAKITDTKGRSHATEITLWVSGDDYVQWNDQDNFALPIVPEKKEYKVGDTAKFLVKNPYPGATALVTVERYGVIDHFLKKLEGSSPVLEIPVKPNYLPGFYLSVLVVSPRVEAPPPEMGQIDMGKPAFRMGYVTVPVRDPYKEIEVSVKPGQDVYRPRDKVKVALQAVPRHVPDPKQPIELAVAVLDESVFDLISAGKSAFDPYEGFYGLDALDMRNYSLLYRLIGRQKFDKKGANPGGDGGADIDMRTLFKYVGYWNPSVKTDANGKANIEFEAPDNLTGWRVLAIATTPTDRLGLGQGNFKVNRPTEVRPVMPNQVREDDQFTAGFSVMNRTDKKRTLNVVIEASGDVQSEEPLSKSETVTLEPYKRATVYFPLKAALLPIEREPAKGEITFHATAADAEDSDGMEYKLPVLKKRVIDVAATYGTTTEDKAEEHIAFPESIYTDTGDVSVVLSPSVIANLTGAFRYIRDYPYPCWEQILTQGVMAAHYKELKSWLPPSFEWKDAEGLPKNMLERAANYQAPNGGMAYFIATDEHADPYLSAYTALAFHWLKKDGYIIPAGVEQKLQDYLINFLKQDAAPDFYQEGMKSTVRAVALAALAQEGKIDAAEIRRYEPHLKDMSLFGKAHFLQAALLFKDTQDAAKKAADMIFAAGNETGGKFMFSETLDDGYLRLLATPLRDNCAILSAFLAYKHTSGEELIGDKPFKLVRTITQSRGSRDHWENTQENMFCMNGLAEFAKAYESVKPEMKVKASLDKKSFGETSFHDFRNEPVTLTRPVQVDDPGKTRNLTLDREGKGRLYYAARLRYAPKSGWENSVNAGMDIAREYSIRREGQWVLLKDPLKVKRGDNVRVDLYLSLPAARNFVVVEDPLPGGLETVNRDLATASSVDDAGAQYDQNGGSLWFKYGDWMEYNASFWSFYHRELRHDSARFYADWLPAGNYHLSYMTQAIADGSFAAPSVRAEEMYDPDVYGRGDNASLAVETK